MPYVYSWSQDVEKCTLDLVLSSCTRTNAAKAIAMASKERQKSLQDPLLMAGRLAAAARARDIIRNNLYK